jgi:hypothetical protein
MAVTGERLQKLVNQHFAFRRDDLGDPSRSDTIWTLPRPLWSWMVLLPVLGLGLVVALRSRTRSDLVFLVVLAGHYLMAFTVSFPEGRYLLPVLPCYAWLVFRGLQFLTRTGNMRTLILATALGAVAIESWMAVRGDYTAGLLERDRSMAGLREAVVAIRTREGKDFGIRRAIPLGGIVLDYQGALYAAMLTNFQYQALDPSDFVSLARSDSPLFALVEHEDRDAETTWAARGFRAVDEVIDGPSRRRFTLRSTE